MKEIYYYETTDDGGITWLLGKPSFSLIGCVDNARQSCYPFRITKTQTESLGEFASYEEIDTALEQLRTFDKLFQ